MEPDPSTHLLKLCNEFPGYTNFQAATPFPQTTPQTISIPRSHAQNPTDTIPTESLNDIKALIAKCLPQFVGRPLINQSMCWCTDTEDAEWLLCHDPRWEGVVLATGDSGKTFKMLPVVGDEVVDLIEGKVSSRLDARVALTNVC
jgi:sarcosine oxidase/L-pipecolate oxidase